MINGFSLEDAFSEFDSPLENATDREDMPVISHVEESTFHSVAGDSVSIDESIREIIEQMRADGRLGFSSEQNNPVFTETHRNIFLKRKSEFTIMADRQAFESSNVIYTQVKTNEFKMCQEDVESVVHGKKAGTVFQLFNPEFDSKSVNLISNVYHGFMGFMFELPGKHLGKIG